MSTNRLAAIIVFVAGGLTALKFGEQSIAYMLIGAAAAAFPSLMGSVDATKKEPKNDGNTTDV